MHAAVVQQHDSLSSDSSAEGSLGDPHLDRIRQGWNRTTKVDDDVHLMLQQATPKQRRLALLACYEAIVTARGLQDDRFAQDVIRLATQAADGRLSGDQLEAVYQRISQQVRTSRGNCIISSVLLSPELNGKDMKGYLETFLREAPQSTDLNRLVRSRLLD